MLMTIHIALAGTSGLAGTLIVVGGLLYDKSYTIAVVLLLVGLLLAIAIVVVELYIRYMDAESRKKEAEARAEWAPFTYGCYYHLIWLFD